MDTTWRAVRVVAVKSVGDFGNQTVFQQPVEFGCNGLLAYARASGGPKGMPSLQIFVHRAFGRDTRNLESAVRGVRTRGISKEFFKDHMLDFDHVVALVEIGRADFAYTELMPVPRGANRSAGAGVEKRGTFPPEVTSCGRYMIAGQVQFAKLFGVRPGRAGEGFRGLTGIADDLAGLNAIAATHYASAGSIVL